MGLKSILRGFWHLKWLLVTLSFWALYSPVIGGILYPMFWPFGATLFYYLTWWIWMKHFPDWWYFATSNIQIEGWYNIAGTIGPALLAIGLTIFAAGLTQIIRARIKAAGLVRSGLYSVVRHPQHLGISIATFGILLWNKMGPRPGDIIAWTILTFLFIMLADGEEAGLKKRFGVEYEAYCSRVPFMIPLFPRISFKLISGRLPKGGWKRRVTLISAYFIFLVVLTACLKALPMVHVRTFMGW